MKVYLINPPAARGIKMLREGRCMQRKAAWATIYSPVTLTTMAAMLLKAEIEVKLDDCVVRAIDHRRLKSNIAEFKPDLLVINTATASIDSDLECASVAKEVSGGIKTVAFGLHVTALAGESFTLQPQLDYIIRGEPEFCLAQLVQALKGKRHLADIKGLSYREKSQIRHNPPRGFAANLDKLPFPAWELIDVDDYRLPITGEPYLLIVTSKGCPYSCLFCPAKPYYGQQVRLRSVQKVVEELVYVKQRFKVRQFLVWSESFTQVREYVMNLCQEIIKRKVDVHWICNSRVDKVDLAMLKTMKQAGCWMIGYGIESGDQKILEQARKGISVAQIEQAIAWANTAGIEVTAHVIFGLPGETLKTGLKTVDWLTGLNVDFIQVYCAVPWPSTPLYKIAQKKDWLRSKNWQFYEQNYCVLDTGAIAPQQVEYLRRRAIRKFYLSPKRLCKLFGKVKSWRSLSVMIQTIKEFIGWI